MSNLFSNIKVTLYNIITLMTVPVKVQLEKKKERNHSKNLKKSCHLITKSCLKFCDPWCSTPGFPVLHYLPEFAKFMSIESVIPSHHLILYRPLLLLPSIFPSIRFFFNESIWSFSFNISPSIAYSGLISFRIDWFDLLAVQKTLKSLQHHSLKASILWHSAFFMVQLSHT